MPLFFTISAIAAYFSLARRSASQFIQERVQRLVVPFVVGLLCIVPVDAYYRAVQSGDFTEGFLQFIAGPYFTRFFPFSLYLSPTFFAGLPEGIYLWYLFWLFVFSIVAVLFFKWLMKEENRNRLSKLYALCNKRGGLLLLAIPIIVVNILAVPPYFIHPSLFAPNGGWKIPTYFVFFVTAYVMAANPRFIESIQKNRLPALLLALLTSVLSLGAFLIAESDPSGPTSHYVSIATYQVVSGWCWVVAILGYGHKFLSVNRKFLDTSNELVLPFYVLHQSVIVAVAFYVVGFDLPAIAKFFIIALVAFPIIAALLYPISRIDWLRFLFGIKTQKASPRKIPIYV
jgi:glucan biosynthesis protein C